MKLKDLTPDDWTNLGQYVAYIRDGLQLYNWTVQIARKPCDREHVASVAPIYGRRYATLFLSRNWPALSLAEQKQTIIHEMLHLHFFDIQSAVDRLSGVLDDTSFHLVWEDHTESLEFAVDHLADVLCRQFDDPPLIAAPN